MIEPRATYDDIDENTIKIFIQDAEKSGRLPESGELSIPQLLDKLRLSENGQLNRGAVILFGKEPSRFYPNLFVKIGRFGKDDADLIFQENIEGNIITQVYAILEMLQYKFLVRKVSFEGINRIETNEYPIPALREVILNALVHRNYMGAATQIRVYDDKIVFWNEGALPQGLSLEGLLGFHASQPRNTLIADVCFKGGYIDSWGRGVLKIYNSCKEAGLPNPEIQEFQSGLLVTLFNNSNVVSEQITGVNLNERQQKAIDYVKENGSISNHQYQTLNSVSDRTSLRDLEKLTQLEIFVKEGKNKKTLYRLK